MERSLDLILLESATEGRTGLPTPDELQDLMANAEIGLILRQAKIDEGLLETAWYLHGVASVNQARERYTLDRQRRAFLVSAHIFDLALSDSHLTKHERLSYGFAAAIGYRRGGRDPNATAIMNRLRDDIQDDIPFLDHFNTLSMEVGLAFLGFEPTSLFRQMANWRRQLGKLAVESDLLDLSTTIFGPTHLVVLGADDLLSYLARGNEERLQRGLYRLQSVVSGDAGPDDLNSRWIAAHLLNFAQEAAEGSLWNPSVLPPTVPSLVRHIFTIGKPAVLTLWEPQRELLTGRPSPFDPQVRRMVLAVPTSGGKTLLGQLLSVEHLARTHQSVCYVVPTRSLGREVRSAMTRRVRLLQKEVGGELPDFPIFGDIQWSLMLPEETADVEVMTPERLSHLLRHDVDGVLGKFGMFIFDEAQLLKEDGRGFTLESVISTLDYLTHDTDHKIILISAAMGNAGAIAQWLSPDGTALLQQSEWRGPRRLHAVFNTKPKWASTIVEDRPGSVWRYQHTTELTGEIRLRMANGRTSALQTNSDTEWRLVRKSKDRNSEKQRDTIKSTKQYIIASEMVAALGHAGSVLVVATTKRQAQQLAMGIAATNEELPALAPLVSFVRQRLGESHPLVGTLRHGVGFHHAGLPVEVLEALEAAVREDSLPYLTCTSTLTDGVNLPVRTVVIYDQGYPGQPEESRLRGARLVNAMGRAGRAGKETEGWIVLVRAAEGSEQDFRDLSPDSDALAVTSSLLTEAALTSIAQLELELSDRQDAIFAATGSAASFISFVWLMLAIEEKRVMDPATISIEQIVDATLGARQSPVIRERYLRVAHSAHRQFLSTDAEARQRWPRTGTSLGSAQIIDALANQIASSIAQNDSVTELLHPESALDILSPSLEKLLALVEAPEWAFKTTQRGTPINVGPEELLSNWIQGHSMQSLTELHLQQATPASWGIEQMVGIVTQQFEHYLAWTVGALVELVNGHLDSAGAEVILCPELAGYIRYGVNSPYALRLMTAGIRSRRLAHVIVADLPPDFPTEEEDLRIWLASMTIAQWRERYQASSSEILDLIDFTRVRQRSLLKTLLESGTVSIALNSDSTPVTDHILTLRSVPGAPFPAPLGLFSENKLIATITSEDHADAQTILDTGFGFALSVDSPQYPRSVAVSLLLDEL